MAESRLGSLLAAKEQQLTLAGTLGQRVLAQQMELEERIRALQERGEDHDDSEGVLELEGLMRTWENELDGLVGTLSAGVGEISEEKDINGAASSSAPAKEPAQNKSQSRRQKNAQHRASDVEFAFEIGSGLLTEVRRLQSLLAERDQHIQTLQNDTATLEGSIEELKKALKAQEESADKWREENWNLEVKVQGLQEKSNEVTQERDQARIDLRKLQKKARETETNYEAVKAQGEKTSKDLDDLRTKHDIDVANFRKTQASAGRERSELQALITSLQADLATAKRRLPRFGSPLTPNSHDRNPTNDLDPNDSLAYLHTPAHPDDGDVFGAPPTTGGATGRRKGEALDPRLFLNDHEDTISQFGNETPETSPTKFSGMLGAPTPEQDKALAQANRTIRGLRDILSKERSRKDELVRLLRKAGVKAPASLESDEEDSILLDEDANASPEQKNRTLRGFPVGRGRGRGGRGMSLAQRLSMVAHRAGSEEPSSDEDIFDEDAEESKASIDSQGLDPTFSKSVHAPLTKSTNQPSPLRQSTLGRSMRGRGRGGGSKRPDSLVGMGIGGDLAKELGMLDEDEPLDDLEEDNDIQVTEVEKIVEVPVEKIVEVPVEKIVEVPVEKIVVKEVIKEVPVEVIKEVETIVEVVKEVPVEKIVEIIKEVPVEVIREVIKEVPVEVVKEVIKEVPVEKIVERQVDKEVPVETVKEVIKEVFVDKIVEKIVIKEVPVEIEKIVEVVKEVPVEVIKEVIVEKIVHVPVEPPKRELVDSETQALSLPSSPASQKQVTPRSSFLAAGNGMETEDEGEETETGADTEYEDALQTPGLNGSATSLPLGPTTQRGLGRGGPPPSAFNFSPRHGRDSSTDDFHSILTVSDYPHSSDSDEESIKAPDNTLQPTQKSGYESSATNSGISVYQSAPSGGEESEADQPSSLAMGVAPIQKRERRVTLRPKEKIVKLDKGIGTDTDEKEAILVPPPKETKIAGTQTDPILPPTAAEKKQQLFHFVTPPIPASVASPSHHRQGSIASRSRTSISERERRESIESLLSQSQAQLANQSAYVDDNTPRAIPPPDKSRPPTFTALPPPPSMPPPGSMGPPSFIPQKPVPKGGQTSLPPPRPTSPPPRDLIERATTPSLYGTQRARHTSGSSTGYPTNNSGVDRRGSATSSIRDKAYTALSYLSNHSNASLSPRSSMDSARLQAPTTPSRMRSARPMSQGFGAGTNPEVIHAITQTMIGEFMYKYTRKAGFGRKSLAALGGGGDPGSGERRHRRFFWVHPYTKTLYWSEGDPGSVHGEGSNAKSAYIEGVRSVLDPNPMPPGLHSYSVVVTTPQREMKITAPTKERHDIWMNALKYLLSRPATNGTGPTGLPGQGSTGLSVPQSPMSVVSDLQSSEGHGQRGRPSLHASPQSQRSGHSAVHVGGNTTTPRGQRSRSQMSLGRGSSVGKRSGTPAAEYLRYGHLESPYSPTRSFVDVGGSRGRKTRGGPPAGLSDEEFEYYSGEDDEDELDFELHGSDEEAMMELGGGPGFDGLENVRACCDGKHTVGGHHHHHHHHHDHETITSPKGSLRPEDRPSSPAWSFRSRAGSTTSSAGGLFGGKLKFGSRREAGKKGSVAPSE